MFVVRTRLKTAVCMYFMPSCLFTFVCFFVLVCLCVSLLYPRISTVEAGDAHATASPWKIFWGKIEVKFEQIKFGQNQNLASPKTFDLLRLCTLYRRNIKIDKLW